MSGWDGLVSTALLGTGRQPVDLAGLPGPAVLGAAEGRLLGAAALATNYRRAGRRAGGPVELPEPAVRDAAEPVWPAAAARLDALLARLDPDLLAEWLVAATAAGRRAPAAALPGLLDAAVRHEEVRAAVAPVLGERGAWLAAFRPDWAGVPVAAASADPQVWDFGEPPARLAYLRGQRRRDPAAARELVAAAWAGEPAQTRADFVAVLAADLTAADEPLLESALDDRARSVREAAAAALRRLPTAAFGTRMAARAAACVRAERHRLRQRITVTPPSECDTAMARDGIATRPTQRGVGQRAWWLEQIVAATPLAAWPGILGTDPAGTIGLPVEGDWDTVLRAGWVAAAITQRDAAWATALLPGAGPYRPGLLAALPPPARAAAVAALLPGHPVSPVETTSANQVTALLGACPGPWPPVLVDAVLAQLARPAGLPRDSVTPAVLHMAGRRLPPAAAPRMAALAAKHPDDSAWRVALTGLADLLTFRHDMHEELR